MQTVSQTIEDVSYVLGLPRSRVNSIARALIDAGILPKSSGRDIKLVEPTSLGGLLAAAAMAEKVDEAASIARRFMGLRIGGDADGETFAAVFADQIQSDDHDLAPTITFGKTREGVTIDISGTFIYRGELSKGQMPFWEARSWGGWTKTSFTIDGSGIVILRNLSQRTYDADGAPMIRKVIN